MKRPDSDLIRRFIKHKALSTKTNFAYPTSSESFASANSRNDIIHKAMSLDQVLELPYFHMAYKDMDDFEFEELNLDPQLLKNSIELLYR